MNRKVLLVEPNYKNKYPPMSLMKLATYFKMVGDNVRFFKGDLKDLVAEDTVEMLLNHLENINKDVDWKRYYIVLLNYIKKGLLKTIDDYPDLTDTPFVFDIIKDYRKYYKNQEYFKDPGYDFVGITTLFTFYWDTTVDTINFVKKLCKPDGIVMVGGVMSTLLPKEIYEATGIYPHVGLLNKAGVIDPDNKLIIDNLPLDYSILDEIEYKYPASDGYYAYMTRGCINHCAFCAVPKLEPQYCDYINLKKQINVAKKRFGEQRNLLLLDNNVLASKKFNKIIDEIKSCGFEKGATYFPPNQYEITIKNLKDGYNDRAYIRKCISLYKKLMDKLPEEEQSTFYLKLENLNCLHYYTATKENILKLDSYVAPLYKKYFKHLKPLKRIVDFNQGVDSRLINDTNMAKLAEINIEPLRIAFDHWELKDIYENSVRTAVRNGITRLSNYMLYNFQDKPDDLYYRMRLNVDLCDELNASIYSFPMKYHPINDPEYFKNRDFIGKHWNRKFIRAIQAVLNSTKGKIGKGTSFFNEAFGRNIDEFHKILWMPEPLIIYRMKFKDNLTKQWEEKFYALSPEDSVLVKQIVATNSFSNLQLDQYNSSVQEVLRYYLISRDSVKDYENI